MFNIAVATYDQVVSKQKYISMTHLLCHVGLWQVIEDESNFLLNIFWGFHNPLSLVCCYQQSVNVCGVDGGLKLQYTFKTKMLLFNIISSIWETSILSEGIFAKQPHHWSISSVTQLQLIILGLSHIC